MSEHPSLPLPQTDDDWSAVLRRTRPWPSLDPYRNWHRHPPRPAAVLVPLLRPGTEWEILFIRRATNQHDPHSGQVSFPGGRCEGNDNSVVATALRETEEEIGLPPDRITVLGRLPSVRTATNYRVHPVVGRIPWPYPFRLQTSEVAQVFTVPLAWLARPEHRELRWRHPPGHPNLAVPVYYFRPYRGHVIWGATARVVLLLLAALGLLDAPTRRVLGLPHVDKG